jgi:hypothetical protein
MAVGGMVGGGIFSVLGVAIEIAGAWAWAAFFVAGALAMATAATYVRLGQLRADGVFAALRAQRPGAGRVLAWLFLLGYVLTLGVYAFTFGHYLAVVFGGGALLERALSLAVIAAFTAVNLAGLKEPAQAEIVAVWTKLGVLVVLAVIGLARWAPERLAAGDAGGGGGLSGVLVASAVVFVAFQGFELLTYDADEIEKPRWTLPRALLPAIGTAAVIYAAVGVAAAMLVGGEPLVERPEVSLALAGEAAAGGAGRVVVSVAAGLAGASAINATLYGAARLVRTLASCGELPRAFERTNAADVPVTAVLVLAVLGAALAVLPSLELLVQASSLTFLAAFAVVNAASIRCIERGKALAAAASVAAAAATVVVALRLV